MIMAVDTSNLSGVQVNNTVVLLAKGVIQCAGYLAFSVT